MTWACTPLTFLLPFLDSTRAPHIDLTGKLSQVMYWVSWSGGKPGVFIPTLTLLVLLVSRRGITFARRWKETLILVLIGTVLGGGGAFFNENVIKEKLKVPRPNIIWLAGENGSLGMSEKEFYESVGKDARRELLTEILNRSPSSLPLSTRIKAHWIHETGYSFPSGHAFTAMFFAAFLLSAAAELIRSKQQLIFYALLPWALAVCYSRTILRVHAPVDITVGGLLGLAVGVAAWVLAGGMIRRYVSQP